MADVNHWPAEAIAALRELHAVQPELSFREIAQRMQCLGMNVTRNACIGKARRLALPRRDDERVRKLNTERLKKAQENRANWLRRERVRKPVQLTPPRVIPMRPVNTRQRHCLLIDLEWGECHWPVNNSRGWDEPHLFCGCTIAPGHSQYCAEHVQMSTQPVRGR